MRRDLTPQYLSSTAFALRVRYFCFAVQDKIRHYLYFF
jgi:hypothetical protein